MGQDQSAEARPRQTKEQLTKHLADRFARKCFTSLELYSLKDNFKSLADHEQDVRYLKEATIARFLEIPDILGASPVLFQAVSYIGAFPFLQDAPAVLGLEQLVIIVTLLTERYGQVLRRGDADRTKLLFKSLAVHDRVLSAVADTSREAHAARSLGHSEASRRFAPGFAVDEAGEDEPEGDGDGAPNDDDDDDDLVLSAFESLDLVEAFRSVPAPAPIRGAMIPADNLRRLLMLLLLVAPLGPQESLSWYAAPRMAGDGLDSLRSTAECVLASFLNVETSAGVRWSQFKRIVPACFPFLFDGLNPLLSHFLFSKNLDFGKKLRERSSDADGGLKNEDGTCPKSPAPRVATLPMALPQPLLQDKAAVLNENVVSQLSFFIPGSEIFRRLRLLYSGDDDGFSMGSFETKVFNWRAPTILLVRGRRMEAVPDGARESAFAAFLPSRRFPDGGNRGAGGPAEGDEDDRADQVLTFGAYVAEPWRLTHRECFGDDSTVLFQLGPVHDVFRTSALNTDRAAFVRSSPSIAPAHVGVFFGCPPPASAVSKTTARHSTGGVGGALTQLGPVSLFLDSGLEFGVFTHDYDGRGGAFTPSVCRRRNFQERFRVESLEVWGCGGNDEAKAQAERWAWEAKEAEARRHINLGTGDIEADRALLEMAGLIGHNRSGGSMA